MKKAIKYVPTVALIAFLAFNSVYFRKLDEMKAVSPSREFNTDAFARDLYYNRLLSHTDSAVDISSLIALLKSDPKKAFEDHSRALAIGDIGYFLVQGEGMIKSIDDYSISVSMARDVITIATEFVYGNAIRDASGLVDLVDFNSTADFNAISENINKIIRNEVLPPFVSKVKAGDTVRFTGAIEVNQKYVDLNEIEVIPIAIDR